MGYISSELGLKITGIGEEERRFIINYFRAHFKEDIRIFIERGLEKLDQIIITKPYKTYSWYLLLYLTTHKLIDHRKAVVYYNKEDPRWTIAGIIYEVLGRSVIPTGLISEGVLSYTAIYKMDLDKIYIKSINEAIEQLSNYTITSDSMRLLLDILPKIISYRLKDLDYGYLVSRSIEGDYEILKLWLSMEPSREEINAVSLVLHINGINPTYYGLPPIEAEANIIEPLEYRLDPLSICKIIDGADEEYCNMLKILIKIAENPDNAWKLLKPWEDEIAPIKDYINEFIHSLENA